MNWILKAALQGALAGLLGAALSMGLYFLLIIPKFTPTQDGQP